MKQFHTLLFLICCSAMGAHAQPFTIQACEQQWCPGPGPQEGAFFFEVWTNPFPSLNSSAYVVFNQNGCATYTLTTAFSNTTQARITPTTALTQSSLSNSEQQASYDRIQRHIDGTEPFTEVWQWLAADANMDSVITNADITLLQQVAAGLYTQYPFPNGPWRFVPKSYVFPNPATPLIPQPPGYISKKFVDLAPSNDFWCVERGNLLYGPNCMLITGTNAPTTFTAAAASPNPTTGGFSVQIQLAQATELRTEVFDLTGKRISAQSSQTYPSGVSTLSFAPIAGTGIFIWKITGADGQYQAGKILRE